MATGTNAVTVTLGSVLIGTPGTMTAKSLNEQHGAKKMPQSLQLKISVPI
jgi:hypothetical protein